MNPGNVLAAGTLEAQLVANAGDAFIVADADGIIRFWNPAAETMFGYSGDEAIGETLDIIVPEPQRKAHWDGYFKTMASGETKYGGKTLSVPAMRADGTRLSVAFTVALLTRARRHGGRHRRGHARRDRRMGAEEVEPAQDRRARAGTQRTARGMSD